MEFPFSCHYEVQENAWMDVSVWHLWVEKVWRPFCTVKSSMTYLLMDEFTATLYRGGGGGGSGRGGGERGSGGVLDGNDGVVASGDHGAGGTESACGVRRRFRPHSNRCHRRRPTHPPQTPEISVTERRGGSRRAWLRFGGVVEDGRSR